MSVRLNDMENLCTEAMNDPRAKTNFLVKKLKVWVYSAKCWIDLLAWGKNAREYTLEDFKDRDCYVGFDLSKKIDFTAVAYIFPPLEGSKDWHSIVKYYYPQDNVQKREKETKVPISSWIEQGYINPIPGSVINYKYIEEDIERTSKIVKIQKIGYDPYNATQVAFHLEELGFEMVEVRQGLKTLNEPCKEFEGMVQSGHFLHKNNPV